MSLVTAAQTHGWSSLPEWCSVLEGKGDHRESGKRHAGKGQIVLLLECVSCPTFPLQCPPHSVECVVLQLKALTPFWPGVRKVGSHKGAQG